MNFKDLAAQRRSSVPGIGGQQRDADQRGASDRQVARHCDATADQRPDHGQAVYRRAGGRRLHGQRDRQHHAPASAGRAGRLWQPADSRPSARRCDTPVAAVSQPAKIASGAEQQPAVGPRRARRNSAASAPAMHPDRSARWPRPDRARRPPARPRPSRARRSAAARVASQAGSSARFHSPKTGMDDQPEVDQRPRSRRHSPPAGSTGARSAPGTAPGHSR